MAESLYLWSTTAASNDTADAGINWQEGQTPGSVNASARSMMAAVAKWLKDTNGTKSTAGTANAYTLASPNTTYAALLDGLIIRIRASFTNTGASTFNLTSLGAKKILTPDAIGDLAAGQIQSGGHYTLEYDSSADSANGAWICLNPGVKSGLIEEFAGSTLPTGYLWCDGTSYLQATYPGLFAAISTTYGSVDGTHFNVPDKRGRYGIGKDNMGGSTASRITAAGCGITGTTLGATGGLETHTLTTGQLAVTTPTGSISSITPTGSVSVSGSLSSGAIVTCSVADLGHSHGNIAKYHQKVTVASGGGVANIWQDEDTVGTAATTTGIGVTVNCATLAANITWGQTAASFTGNATTPAFTGNSFGSGQAHNNVPPGIVVNYIIKY